MKSMKLHRITGLTLAVVLLTACASTPPAPEQTVEQRAQARWNHLIAGEAAEALAYFTPGYRAITPERDFDAWLRGRPVKWLAAEVKSGECSDPDRCRIVTAVTYRVPNAPTGINEMRMTRDIEEEWIRLDGQWWYVQN